MSKKLIIFGLFLIGLTSFAQQNSSSPYSYFGIGENRLRGTQDARAMGGLGIMADSTAINILNPASYSRLQLTSFAVGGTTNFNTLKNSSLKESANRTNLDYLVIGIPMGKFGASFGLMPLSSVGYQIRNDVTTSDGDQIRKEYIGSGNVNRFFVGTSYSFSDNLSVGLDLQYNFGSTDYKIIQYQTNAQLRTRELNTAQLGGFSANIGLLYSRKLKNGLNFYSSLTYSPEVNLESKNTRNTALVSFSTTGEEFVTTSQNSTNISNVVLPSKTSFGFGIGETRKWLIGTQITLTNSSKNSNVFGPTNNSSFKNGQSYTLGGFYLPNHQSFTSYWERVIYRAGLRYESTGLLINNTAINDIGMNFGFGLPLGYSKVNVGFELGQKGTTKNNLIKENYFNVSVGFSLSDKWFNKRKID